MSILRITGLILALAGLSACTKFVDYDGPQVTRIEVHKAARRMYLLNGTTILESYEFELGFSPIGDKQVEGDGRTPEGRYTINRRNPNSAFYLSIGLSYPNAEDIAEAAALGQSPGGDIFIHGTPNPFQRGDDWTWGCIAVTNAEMRQIYAMVENGTIIDVFE
ncbi:MAG: murein L,D-transpeptidase YafK [Paracoccaceae bacterium]|jgi:murein L,D-transpeptidase YafK